MEISSWGCPGQAEVSSLTYRTCHPTMRSDLPLSPQNVFSVYLLINLFTYQEWKLQIPRVSYAFDKTLAVPKVTWWKKKIILPIILAFYCLSNRHISNFLSGMGLKAGFWVNTDNRIAASPCLDALDLPAFSHMCRSTSYHTPSTVFAKLSSQRPHHLLSKAPVQEMSLLSNDHSLSSST